MMIDSKHYSKELITGLMEYFLRVEVPDFSTTDLYIREVNYSVLALSLDLNDCIHWISTSGNCQDFKKIAFYYDIPTANFTWDTRYIIPWSRNILTNSKNLPIIWQVYVCREWSTNKKRCTLSMWKGLFLLHKKNWTKEAVTIDLEK